MFVLLSHNIFQLIALVRRNPQAIHIVCLAMNSSLFLLGVVISLRDPLAYSCELYSGLIFTIYVTGIAFAGTILLMKAYYASGFSKMILGWTIAFQAGTVAAHIVASACTTVTTNHSTFMCDIEFDRTSFVISMATDCLFNCTMSAIFLVYIFRAYSAFNSAPYMILFRDGMLFWLATSLFPIIISLASFTTTVYEFVTGLSIIYLRGMNSVDMECVLG
ncbi:hypothetical protein H4R33_001369 [Dimargaris cristalligena]|nr:hypothetical protein H4R33_001369 [Dimargaris cristalligena]